MCNLYSVTKGQQAIRELADAMHDRVGNLPPLPGIFPDYSAPIVRRGPEGRELAMARWGMPSPSFVLTNKRTDARSEEHTSELQSLMRTSYAVFCLKTKKNQKTQHHNPNNTQ